VAAFLPFDETGEEEEEEEEEDEDEDEEDEENEEEKETQYMYKSHGKNNKEVYKKKRDLKNDVIIDDR